MHRFGFAPNKSSQQQPATKNKSVSDPGVGSSSSTFSSDVRSTPLSLIWTSGEWRGHFENKDDLTKAKQLVREKVPMGHRGEVWKLSTLAVRCQRRTPELYKLLKDRPSPHEEAIRQDLHRTLGSHIYLKSEEGQQSLYRVLNAYAKFDHLAGYTQGLSFIAAVLLLNMEEEFAFWCLVDITRRFLLRPSKDNPSDHTLLRQALFQLDRLLLKYLPRLHQHLKFHGVEASLIASAWFSSLFSYNFPIPLVFRIWDVLLLEDTPYLFSVALAILKLSEEDVLSLDACEEIVKYLKGRGRTLDSEKLIETADSIGVTEGELFSLEHEFTSPVKMYGATIV